MAITNANLADGTLGTSSATLYTVPASTKTIVKSITLCNKTTASAKATITFNAVNIIYQKPLAASETLQILPEQILNAAEVIAGLSDTASAIDYYISGKEET